MVKNSQGGNAPPQPTAHGSEPRGGSDSPGRGSLSGRALLLCPGSGSQGLTQRLLLQPFPCQVETEFPLLNLLLLKIPTMDPASCSDLADALPEQIRGQSCLQTPPLSGVGGLRIRRPRRQLLQENLPESASRGLR